MKEQATGEVAHEGQGGPILGTIEPGRTNDDDVHAVRLAKDGRFAGSLARRIGRELGQSRRERGDQDEPAGTPRRRGGGQPLRPLGIDGMEGPRVPGSYGTGDMNHGVALGHKPIQVGVERAEPQLDALGAQLGILPPRERPHLIAGREKYVCQMTTDETGRSGEGHRFDHAISAARLLLERQLATASRAISSRVVSAG
jgi:hypothetical protein